MSILCCQKAFKIIQTLIFDFLSLIFHLSSFIFDRWSLIFDLLFLICYPRSLILYFISLDLFPGSLVLDPWSLFVFIVHCSLIFILHFSSSSSSSPQSQWHHRVSYVVWVCGCVRLREWEAYVIFVILSSRAPFSADTAKLQFTGTTSWCFNQQVDKNINN